MRVTVTTILSPIQDTMSCRRRRAIQVVSGVNAALSLPQCRDLLTQPETTRVLEQHGSPVAALQNNLPLEIRLSLLITLSK